MANAGSLDFRQRVVNVQQQIDTHFFGSAKFAVQKCRQNRVAHCVINKRQLALIFIDDVGQILQQRLSIITARESVNNVQLIEKFVSGRSQRLNVAVNPVSSSASLLTSDISRNVAMAPITSPLA